MNFHLCAEQAAELVRRVDIALICIVVLPLAITLTALVFTFLFN